MDDLKVQQYIDASFAWQNSVFRGADRLSKAWNWLYMKRQNEDPNDDNAEMAAAEHYMWARWQVGTGEISAFTMYLLVFGYDVVKLLGYLPTTYAARWAINHKWSSPSVGSIEWGNQGIADGVKDENLLSRNPGAMVR